MTPPLVVNDQTMTVAEVSAALGVTVLDVLRLLDRGALQYEHGRLVSAASVSRYAPDKVTAAQEDLLGLLGE